MFDVTVEEMPDCPSGHGFQICVWLLCGIAGRTLTERILFEGSAEDAEAKADEIYRKLGGE